MSILNLSLTKKVTPSADHWSKMIRLSLALLVAWVTPLWGETATLRVAVFKEIVGFGQYARLVNGQFSGEMATVFDCVADQLSVDVDYLVAPAKRGIHTVRMGKADLLLPIPVVEGTRHRWKADLVFSDVLHSGYWLLVHRAQEQVEVQPPFTDVTLGMYYRAAYHERFKQLPTVSATSHIQLYRLLVSGRINLISAFQPWPAEQVLVYEGHPLQAHLYRVSPYRAGISRQSVWSQKAHRDKLNAAIRACRESFRLEERSPFHGPLKLSRPSDRSEVD